MPSRSDITSIIVLSLLTGKAQPGGLFNKRICSFLAFWCCFWNKMRLMITSDFYIVESGATLSPPQGPTARQARFRQVWRLMIEQGQGQQITLSGPSIGISSTSSQSMHCCYKSTLLRLFLGEIPRYARHTYPIGVEWRHEAIRSIAGLPIEQNRTNMRHKHKDPWREYMKYIF